MSEELIVQKVKDWVQTSILHTLDECIYLTETKKIKLSEHYELILANYVSRFEQYIDREFSKTHPKGEEE